MTQIAELPAAQAEPEYTELPPLGTAIEDVQGPAVDLATRLKRESMDVRDPFIEWADLGRNYFHPTR
jgi:hypothetical protein